MEAGWETKPPTLIDFQMCFCVLRLKKSCLTKITHFHTASIYDKGGDPRETGVKKLPFTPIENFCNQMEELPVMAHRRTKLDPHNSEATLLVGSNLPRSSGGKIKEKISLWEGKEPSGGVKKTQSPNNCRATEEEDLDNSWRKGHVGRENGDSRSCSPCRSPQQVRGTIKSSKTRESLKVEDCSGVVCSQDYKKENVENLVAPWPCSLAETGGFRGTNKLNGNRKSEDCRSAQGEHLEEMGDSRHCLPAQEGSLRRSGDRKKATETSQEKRAVFNLFRKLEAMGENQGRTPTELGNYFSPPSKDKYMEFKRTESQGLSQAGTAERAPNCENVYAEPGALPINPVPKPQRTFQHPSFEKSQKKGRGQRNLPPLPIISAKPPSGVFLRHRGEVRDSMNRYHPPPPPKKQNKTKHRSE